MNAFCEKIQKYFHENTRETLGASIDDDVVWICLPFTENFTASIICFCKNNVDEINSKPSFVLVGIYKFLPILLMVQEINAVLWFEHL